MVWGLFCVSLLYGQVSVEFTQPKENTIFYEDQCPHFKIEVSNTFPVFPSWEDDNYYFWYTEERGDPYPYPWYDPSGSERGGRPHHGVDIAFDLFPNIIDKHIIAGMCGKVTFLGYDPNGWGYYVLIYYPQINKTFMYAHLDEDRPSLNSYITTNEIISCGGQSGNLYPANPHVHIEVYDGERAYPGSPREDPLPLLYENNLNSLALTIWDASECVYSESYDISNHSFINIATHAAQPFIQERTVCEFPAPDECDEKEFTAEAWVYGDETVPCNQWQQYYADSQAWAANPTLPKPERPQPETEKLAEDILPFIKADLYLRGVLLHSNIACDMSYALGCNYEETIPPCDCARSIVNRFYFGNQYMGVKSIRLWTAFPQTYSANGAIYGTPGIC